MRKESDGFLCHRHLLLALCLQPLLLLTAQGLLTTFTELVAACEGEPSYAELQHVAAISLQPYLQTSPKPYAFAQLSAFDFELKNCTKEGKTVYLQGRSMETSYIHFISLISPLPLTRSTSKGNRFAHYENNVQSLMCSKHRSSQAEARSCKVSSFLHGGRPCVIFAPQEQQPFHCGGGVGGMAESQL